MLVLVKQYEATKSTTSICFTDLLQLLMMGSTDQEIIELNRENNAITHTPPLSQILG